MLQMQSWMVMNTGRSLLPVGLKTLEYWRRIATLTKILSGALRITIVLSHWRGG